VYNSFTPALNNLLSRQLINIKTHELIFFTTINDIHSFKLIEYIDTIQI